MTEQTIRLNDHFRWPSGKRVAVIFNIAYEAWSEGQAPGIGPMGNVLNPGYFDTNAHSWASFGAVRGINRLLDFADHRGVKTSVMVNGVLAQTAPSSVKEIYQRGHEIVNHSWGMDVLPVYLSETEELANIICLFRLDFIDAAAVPRALEGKPVYLGIAMNDEKQLKLKPQNLLFNLPLAKTS